MTALSKCPFNCETANPSCDRIRLRYNILGYLRYGAGRDFSLARCRLSAHYDLLHFQNHLSRELDLASA
jgi:hypothetical protein